MGIPLVSVAIPAYNHSKFIEACLASVCEQTYPELELVLIDDGSTDGTYDIAQRFLEAHRARFRRIVVERRENQGVSANSNACIEACQGEWVHLLGSDDIIYPRKIEQIQQAISEWKAPDLALVHADVDLIDENGERVTRKNPKGRPDPGPQKNAFRELFLEEYFIFNPTVTLHRPSFLALGGFDRNLPLEDMDCWLRLAARYSIARIPETLASYRKHPGNTSRQRIKMLGAQFITSAKFLAENPGAIPDNDIRSHYRLKMKRVWRRTRKQCPWLGLEIIRSLLRSYKKTPRPDDFRRFGDILGRLARQQQPHNDLRHK